MDCLALREHIGKLLVAGLCRREPLQSSALLRRLHTNANGELRLCRSRVLAFQVDCQRRAVRLDSVGR